MCMYCERWSWIPETRYGTSYQIQLQHWNGASYQLPLQHWHGASYQLPLQMSKFNIVNVHSAWVFLLVIVFVYHHRLFMVSFMNTETECTCLLVLILYHTKIRAHILALLFTKLILIYVYSCPKYCFIFLYTAMYLQENKNLCMWIFVYKHFSKLSLFLIS